MATSGVNALEYRNDFFGIKISPLKHRSAAYHYSIGLSLPKFNPIIWGRTGICSNAAFKGLQQLRADVASYAHQLGSATVDAGIPCTNVCSHVDGWFQESDLIIENASPEAIRDILAFSARTLVQTILNACQPGVTVPAGLDAAAMQRFLESLGVPNYREMAPPPVAKPQAA
jgi:hypothetical protein